MQNSTKINDPEFIPDITSRNMSETVVETVMQEINYSGLGVSPGIAIGVAYVHNPSVITVPKYRIEVGQIEEEQKRVVQASQKTERQLLYLKHKVQKLPDSSGEEIEFLLDAYGQMLKNSRLIRGVLDRIRKDQINAEAAVQTEIAMLAEAFASMEDSYLSSRLEDVRSVGLRLIRNLTKEVFQPFAKLPKNSVIISHELTPADTAMLDPNFISGFATVKGGAQSHTGLLARSLALPAVIGVDNLMSKVRTGDPVIIDGTFGLVIVCPSREVIDRYSMYRQDFLRWRDSLSQLKDLPSVTTDNFHISLKGNIDLPSEIEVLLQSGAEGIGLLRTEYMFMNKGEIPDEKEQFETLRNVIHRLNGQPVTIRTLDVGGDKPNELVATGTGSNPALGLRGIRCSLKWQDLLEIQLSAILRASVYGPVNIMLPMVSDVSEVIKVREIMAKLVEKLRQNGVDLPNPLPPLGIMIETPSAALMAESYLGKVDFFSIGTNDLTQYTLAVDRTNQNVAHLYNTIHPSVLRLIKITADAAAKGKIPVSMCGEMAANAHHIKLLLGLGIYELSMPATNIPTVKERVRSINMNDARNFANYILSLSNADEIRNIIYNS
ncbi:MAG: phosphoenolpyruvate--protein phosphotransferase [Alphaproteobacteria bacterium]